MKNILMGKQFTRGDGKLKKNIVLFGDILCPFVQRAAIGLNLHHFKHSHVQVPFDGDYSHLPPNELRFPMIQVDRTFIFESASIVQFLDEIGRGRGRNVRLISSDPELKAQERAWTHFTDTRIAAKMLEMLKIPKHDKLRVQILAEELAGDVRLLEGQFQKRYTGMPFFNGVAPGLIEVMLYPFLQRGFLLEHFKQIHLIPPDCPILIRLYHELFHMKSFTDVSPDLETLILRFPSHPSSNWVTSDPKSVKSFQSQQISQSHLNQSNQVSAITIPNQIT